MTLDELRAAVRKRATDYAEAFGIRVDREFATMKLFEEAGEVAEAVLTLHGQSRPTKEAPEERMKERLAEELADVIAMAVLNADLHHVDLESALRRKWIEKAASGGP